jgi:hypothetical protein
MKCIKHILTNEVRRVTDEEAEAIRAADKLEPKCWQYCPKHEWKARRGK